MAVQRKILLGDVGSAVQEEVTSQLNRACSYANFFSGTFTENASDASNNRPNVGDFVTAGMSALTSLFPAIPSPMMALWTVPEDVLIVDIHVGFVEVANVNGLVDQDDFFFVATDVPDDPFSGNEVWTATDFGLPGRGIPQAVVNDAWVSLATLQPGADPDPGMTMGTFPIAVKALNEITNGPNVVAVLTSTAPDTEASIFGISISYRPIKDELVVKNVTSGAGNTFRSVPRS